MSFSLIDADEAPRPRKPSLLKRAQLAVEPTVRYWFGLDSHVYAMAIAASVLFGFFPFMVLILSLGEHVFPWSEAEHGIYLGLRAFLPEDPGLVDFVIRNLRAAVAQRGAVQLVSVFLLMLAANGIFMPLEVAQNRLWGFRRHRSYWRNQATSFCLTFVAATGALAAAMFAVTVGPSLARLFRGWPASTDGGILLALKIAETPLLILLMVLIFWALPNGPVPLRRVIPVAVLTAAVIEIAQFAYSAIWPWLDLRGEYGPFFISVTLMLWGFLAAMAVLGGGEICARRKIPLKSPPTKKFLSDDD